MASERYPGKTLIGLTGNIAVGKSLARQMLQELGAVTIDADQVAHEVILRGSPTYDKIVAAFGEGIIGKDGEIERAALGRIVFAESAKLKILEGITHPAIRQRTDQLIRNAEATVVVIEAIKLLEGRLKDIVDAVWVVHASPETQLSRLRSERGFIENDARQRIDAQNKQADKLCLADVIIENDGNIEETRAQVLRHWRGLSQ